MIGGTRGWGLSFVVALLLTGAQARAEDGRYIVGLRDQTRGRAALAAQGARFELELGPQSAIAVRLPEPAVEALRRNPAIEYVEDDPRRYPLGQAMPYGVQLVQAPAVWPLAGGASRRICVIDSGMAIGHEDLQTDRVTGYPSDWSRDGCGHGTHVIGTMAALDNDRGVVGVLPDGISLHVVRVFGDDCSWAYASTLIDALNRCRGAGADVVSMSLGGLWKSSTESRAFDQAFSAGVLPVAAAGNNGTALYSYPASYPSVVSVAAVDSSKTVASFSQHNSQVELAAPGVAVLSTVPGNGYEAWSGTSMATPHVSAVAALIWSYNPGWTNAQVRGALCATAEDLGAVGRDSYYGCGLVQAAAALDYLRGANSAPTASFTWRCDGLTCSFTDASTDSDGAVVGWSWNFGGQGSSTAQNPQFTFQSAGTHAVALTVTDDDGATGSKVEQVAVTTEPAPGIELTAVGYKVRALQRVDLSWSGATGAQVDVWRDGAKVATTANDSAYTDLLGVKKGGPYQYRLCEAGSVAVCSNTVMVSFQ